MKNDWIRKEIERMCRDFRTGRTYYQNVDTLVTKIESQCRIYRALHPNSTKTENDSERKEEVTQ